MHVALTNLPTRPLNTLSFGLETPSRFTYLTIFTPKQTNIPNPSISHYPHIIPNMSNWYSQYKSSITVILLVLVPIVVICSILAVALACSEFWSARKSVTWVFWVKPQDRSKGKRTSQPDLEQGRNAPPAYQEPLRGRDEI
ncbi:hypothetical protein BO94DRAFT_50918 [Aspergillus sclerotioniger CBS 115572]|uniref:Uncharacterized protein n=1 Tax=Aspergillus sclerotioniger CBS 115572 TaxID=1450535 RepID=A0A317WQI3_9EURO|nr:hypothetical protein BO94DRAFT_50918 [Aspergillus sclerotioniger CBS 115572]PWY88764.1 hypothetical protein BO94DRAFT_50918 [Aspergillus sclerotioniger CBS 115572]